MSPLLVFDVFLVAHIACGVVGLLTFWVAVIGRKGGEAHVRYGRIFAWTIFVTSLCAVGMSLLSIVWPLETHPKLKDEALVRGIFGHFMLFLAVFTISLVWHGLRSVALKADHARHRERGPLAIQGLVVVTGVNAIVQGLAIGQPLMLALPIVGFSFVALALWFELRPEPWRLQYVVEHFKALVGAGISVYTAFFAFGAVRMMPHNAFHPLLWGTPLLVGLAIILWHWLKYQRLKRRTPRRPPIRATASSTGT